MLIETSVSIATSVSSTDAPKGKGGEVPEEDKVQGTEVEVAEGDTVVACASIGQFSAARLDRPVILRKVGYAKGATRKF